MNICIAADENYATILKVVMLSVMENNRKAEQLTFHIFEYKMSESNKTAIKGLAEKYGRKAILYSMDDCIEAVRKKITNEWVEKNSYVTYARLYMSDMLPDSVETFLYLDCDTLVTGDLNPLFDIDMKDYVLCGVKDVLPYSYKKWKGLENGAYYNAGILYMNSRVWREENITKFFADYNHSNDAYADQDAINHVLSGRIITLAPKYCVFYPEYGWNWKRQLQGYGGDESTYYTKEELEEARNQPIIIHYVDSVLGRPWQSNNINPYSRQWMKYYDMLPESEKIHFKPKEVSWKNRIFRTMYKVFPETIFSIIYYNNRNRRVFEKMEVH